MTRPPRPPKQRRLAFRLTLLILTSTTLIFLAAFGYNYYHSRQLMLKGARQSAMHLAQSVVLQIEARLRAVETLPRMVAHHLERPVAVGTVSADRLHDLMQDMMAGTPDIFGAAAAFEPYAFDAERQYYAPYFHHAEDGRLVFTQLGSKDYNYFLWDWYLIPRELERPVWSEPYFDEGGGGILMATYSQPFYDRSDATQIFRGVVTADISLEELVAQINDISLYKTGYAFLLSRNGAFLAHPNPTYMMRESIFSLAEAKGRPELRTIGRQMCRGSSGFATLTSVHTGCRSLLAYAPVKAAGWAVGVVIAENELLADLENLNHHVLAIGAVGFTLLLLVVVAISRSITRPLQRLVHTTEEIARGNLEAALPVVHTRDEVQVLSRSVDEMRLALKEYIADIAATSRAKERIESELKIASAIQMNFLPKQFPPFPDQTAFDLYAALAPAREVGGDLYDFFMLDDDHLFYSVGDVSDKGVPAALFMAVTKTLMKGIAEQGLTPADVLARVNVELCSNNEAGMFVTVACGILDVTTGDVHYSNAGHNPPVLLRAGKAPDLLPMPPGLVLGAMEAAVYANRVVRLNPGDRLLLYTDGVTEAMDAGQRLFSETRLLLEMARLADAEPRRMVEEIMAVVETHANGTAQSDDITVLALHFKGPRDGSQ
jgi:sigma-B regulation protein RsbU (phosphoserine phosphatase)